MKMNYKNVKIELEKKNVFLVELFKRREEL